MASISSKLSSSNFLRQFRDVESREMTRLSAVQFMEVWEHYDSDGKFKGKKDYLLVFVFLLFMRLLTNNELRRFQVSSSDYRLLGLV